MKRGLKFILTLLLAWYVVGPLVETVDFWDDLPAEMRDIARSAGGLVTLAVVGISLAIALHRQLQARCSSFARTIRGYFQVLPFHPFLPLIPAVESPSHSPPSPLRI
jgi:hypothetical protein